MFGTHTKLAVRSAFRRPVYSLLNVAGLAFGLICCIPILLLVHHELSYDRFHDNRDRIVRLDVDASFPEGGVDRFATTSRLMHPILTSEYPDVKNAVRLLPYASKIHTSGPARFDDAVLAADPSVFDVFTFPLHEGDASTALNAPYTMVVTASLAADLFGTRDAIGQVLTVNDTLTVTVTGVAEDVPATSHIQFDALLSWATIDAIQPPQPEDWLMLRPHTYVLLHANASAETFRASVREMIMQHQPFGADDLGGMTITVGATPMTDVYLHSDRQMELGASGSGSYVAIFILIAALVLLVACVNFTNLATARSIERAQEVGVRKTLGSGRSVLVRQFLLESLLTAGAALVIALLVTAPFAPLMSDLLGRPVPSTAMLAPSFLGLLVLITLVTGLLAGAYPALILSSYRPIDVLKGGARSTAQGGKLRHALVVVQFALSVVLIAGTLIVDGQIRFMLGQDPGFDKEQVLVVNVEHVEPAFMARHYPLLRDELSATLPIHTVSGTSGIPGEDVGVEIMYPEGLTPGESRQMRVLETDTDVVETLGLHLVAGRTFARDRPNDVTAALVNEAAVRAFGWGRTEDAIGRSVRAGSDDRLLRVIGVVRDFHYAGFRTAVEPVLVRLGQQSLTYVTARLATSDAASALAATEAVWGRLLPEYPLKYVFLDDAFDQQFRSEQRFGALFALFSAFAIVIACLGLFGLALFVTNRRAKEIGVRRVLGASVTSVAGRLSGEFARLIVLATVVGLPVAYVAAGHWLRGFAYAEAPGYLPFAVAALAVLTLGVLTVGAQSVKAALSDPVRCLRDD